MRKKVIVVASGETERRSLPHLTANLAEEGVHVAEIRIPPRHRDLTVGVAVQLIDAAWFEYQSPVLRISLSSFWTSMARTPSRSSVHGARISDAD